jgi:hypothetical protein
MIVSGLISRHYTPATFDEMTLANQRIVTVSEAKTINVHAPSDTAVEFWYAGSKVADMTDAGSGNWTCTWTPTSTDYTGSVAKAVGNNSGSSQELVVVVATANRIANTNLMTWTLVGNTMTRTSGIADPFGGTSAYRFTMPVTPPATDTGVNQNGGMSPSLTTNNHSIEMWYRRSSHPTAPKAFSITVSGGGGGRIDCVEGWSFVNKSFMQVVERRADGWERVWVTLVDQASATSQWFINISDSLFATNGYVGGEYIDIAFVRSIDAQLPFTINQQLSFYLESVSGVQEIYAARHPYTSTLPTAGISNHWHVIVIKPTGWTKAGNYKTIFFYPAIVDTGEAVQGGTIQTLLAAGDYANTHNCVLIVCKLGNNNQYAGRQWGGVNTNGDYNRSAYWGELMPFVARKFLGASSNPNKMACCGYSATGWAALAVMIRHTDNIGIAASFDAPHTASYTFGGAGFDQSFTTEANWSTFNPIERIAPDKVKLSDRTRIVLEGYTIYDTHFAALVEEMDAEGVPYLANDTDFGGHRFSSGWLPTAISNMISLMDD